MSRYAPSSPEVGQGERDGQAKLWDQRWTGKAMGPAMCRSEQVSHGRSAMDGAAMDEQWLVRAGMLRACHVGMLGPAGRKRWTGKAMDEPSYGKSYVHESKSAMDGCETGQLWKGGLCADQLWTCEKARVLWTDQSWEGQPWPETGQHWIQSISPAHPSSPEITRAHPSSPELTPAHPR